MEIYDNTYENKRNEINKMFKEFKDDVDKITNDLTDVDTFNLLNSNISDLISYFAANKFHYMNEGFKFLGTDINNKIDENNLNKVCMEGTFRELKHLKPIIEMFFSRYIEYLDYWKGECGYHGWNWNDDDGTIKNQALITSGITQKFIEIYALILSGIGERCDEL